MQHLVLQNVSISTRSPRIRFSQIIKEVQSMRLFRKPEILTKATSNKRQSLPQKLRSVSIFYLTMIAATNTYAASVNTDKFDSVFYVKYAPQTLYDMLQNTPGANSLLVDLESTSQNRGFGSSGDQILINNQRISGKENSIDKELANIQAKDVEYIEVIRGTNSELAVQSKGVVVNVVLKEINENSLLWTLGTEKVDGLPNQLIGSVFLSARNGDFKYRIGVIQEAAPRAIDRHDRHFTPNKQHFLTSDYKEKTELTRRRANGQIEYQLTPSSALKINGLYEKYYLDRSINKQTEYLLTPKSRFETTSFDYDRDKWEIGGDINTKVNDDNELRLLFISNETDAIEKLWLTSASDKQNSSLVYQLPRNYITSENIVRGNWKYNLNGAHTFDSGVEVAINKRDEKLELIRADRDYHSIESNDIKETRYEMFVNHNYAIASDLNLQLSLIYEKSTMDVSTGIQVFNDTSNEVEASTSRTFNYLKPRLNLRYDIDDIYQLRFNYERTVSQLSLHDFVPWYNQFESRLEPVNSKLEPELRDEYSLSIEKKWQSTSGSISLTPYYHDINELITEIPLNGGSGNGNIDSAKEYGLTLKTHFGLQYFGFDNTLISASYTWRDSEMIHPFTGFKAALERTQENLWDLKINQNEILPGLSMSASFSNKTPHQFNYYNYLGRVSSELTLDAQIDYKINNQLKLRLAGENLLNRKYVVFKDRYTGHVAQSDFLRYEVRDNEFSPELSLTLTGQY